MQSNLSYILFFLFSFCWFSGISQDIPKKAKKIPVTKKDTVPVIKKDSLAFLKKNDSLLLKKNDTVALDSIKPKEAISDKITHTAKDYTAQDAINKTVTLYNEAHVTYEDIDLKAGIIVIDYLKSVLYAKGIKDSTGYIQRPVFKQGNEESEQDSLIYNFETKKAIIYNIKTEQAQGIYVLGEKAKRVNDSTIYMRNIKFTTSDKKIPDYHIGVNKAKLVPGKKIVAGVSNLVLAEVPTPVMLPFAYFPITSKRTSGFIIPSWNTGTDRGFGIQNGGFYFVINDYVDLEVLTDLYTNGSWSLRTNSQYYKRYKYSGNFRLSFEKLINGLRGFDDFTETNNFNIQWSHRKDGKSNPNSNFSASVNVGSSQYFRQSLNEVNNPAFLNNTFNSSISYQRNFVGTPFSMNVTATHSQNSNTEQINMTLPSLQVNMNRIYPFVGKGGVKKTPIHNIGLTYDLQGKYEINTTDEEFLKAEMFQSGQAGIQHTAAASTNVRMLKYFTLSPSVNYREVWNFDHIEKRYDDIEDTVVTDTLNGFKSFRQYSASMSISTNIYGDFKFKKGRLKAIRHTVRPSISFSYTPDFAERYIREVQASSDPTDIETYTPFDQGIYGGPSAGTSGAIGFTLNNVLEAKVAPKDPDSDEEDKKITLLNNLNFSTSYNIAADSLRWSDLRVTAGTRLFKEKMALNVNATFDPYQVDQNTGLRINKFNKGFYRLESANITANYSLSSKDFQKEDDKDPNKNSGNGAQITPDVLGANIRPTNSNSFSPSSPNQNEEVNTELYRSKIPWTLNLAYSASYRSDGYRTNKIQSHTLMFGGNFELSPKWKVGFNSGYDVVAGGFSFTRLNFARDLDSWNFSFNWVPFGLNQSYTFFIGVKSGVLQDLKYDQNRPPNRVLF